MVPVKVSLFDLRGDLAHSYCLLGYFRNNNLTVRLMKVYFAKNDDVIAGGFLGYISTGSKF